MYIYIYILVTLVSSRIVHYILSSSIYLVEYVHYLTQHYHYTSIYIYIYICIYIYIYVYVCV